MSKLGVPSVVGDAGSSGRASFVDEMSSALTSTESPSYGEQEGEDPVVDIGDLNEPDEQEVNDGSEQGIESGSEASQAAEAKSAEEWYTFKGDGGSKRFNLADKEAIKKMLPLAEGARRWQSERDSWKSKYSEIERPYTELKGNWDRLEQAFQREGIEGVLDIIQGKPGASKEYWESKYQERLAYEKAPEHERARIDHERMIDELRREKENFKIEAENRAAKLKEIQETEAQTQMIADLRPHFNNYRFDGKLGNERAEARYNNMVWDDAVMALAKWSAENGEARPSSQQIKAEFKRQYDEHAAVLKVNQTNAAKAAVTSAQSNAKKSLASSVRSQTTASGADKPVNTGSSANSLSSAWQKMFNVK